MVGGLSSPKNHENRGIQMNRRGFTLVELLIVIVIIAIVSAVALPTILPALQHRQVSEAARIVQAALVGARDDALKNGSSSGIRLMPDPAFPLVYLANGQLDPTQPLVANRIIPLAEAPQYTTGRVSFVNPSSAPNLTVNPVLMIKEVVVDPNGQLNEPTSWFWNVRLGDKIQLNGAGIWYTVVGPLVLSAADGNSELFVNVGAPGTKSPWPPESQGGATVSPEFLFLSNGVDDVMAWVDYNGNPILDKNGKQIVATNGYVDEGWDGIDNDGDGLIDTPGPIGNGSGGEWEPEKWATEILSSAPTNIAYVIRRRPAPAPNSREVSLPSNVVIDLTTWSLASPERSQFPIGIVNPYTGYADIMLNSNGSVAPSTLYSAPSAYGMNGAILQLWLAERSDVSAPIATATASPFLPIGNIRQQLAGGVPYGGPFLKGEYRIVSIFARTGRVSTSDDVQFDNPLNPDNGKKYNPGYPFLAARLGSK